jgi:hypothetical protein
VLSSRHKIKGQICPYRGPSFMGFAIRKVMATKKIIKKKKSTPEVDSINLFSAEKFASNFRVKFFG